MARHHGAGDPDRIEIALPDLKTAKMPG